MKKQLLSLALLALLCSCSPAGETSGSLSNSENSENSSISSSEIVPSTSDEASSETTSTSEIQYSGMTEILSNLKTSPYRNEMYYDGNLGLSDIKSVGLDKERFMNETLYPIPTEGTFYKASDIGLKTGEDQDNANVLTRFINSIKNVKGNKIIELDNGDYEFDYTLRIEGIDDLYIVGKENTNWYLKKWYNYVYFKFCKNIHFNNIKFDMKWSATLGGKITKVTEGENSTHVQLAFDKEKFDLSNELYQKATLEQCSYIEMKYDEATKSYTPNFDGNLMYNSPTSTYMKGLLSMNIDSVKNEIDLEINKKWGFAPRYKTPKVGYDVSLALRMYNASGLRFDECEDTYLEHVDMYTTAGMGVQTLLGKNVYINHLNEKLREGAGRFMTTCADMIHGGGTEGQYKITNCQLENSHDDAINIKTFYTTVKAINPAKRQLNISQTQSEFAVGFEIGDEIEVYEPKTVKLIDKFIVKDVVKSGTSYEVTLDKRPRNIGIGYLVANVTKASRITVDNCYIRNKRNRGILCQGRDCKIINTTFQNVMQGTLQVFTAADQFREGIVPVNTIIESNKFLTSRNDINIFAFGEGGSNASTPGTVKDVVVKNNYFLDGKDFTFQLLGAGNIKIENNLMEYNTKCVASVLKAKNSCDIFFRNNVMVGQKKDEIPWFKEESGVTNYNEENNIKKEFEL